jgi:protein TonB
MFANSLCDSPGADRSGADRSWAIRSHRGWATLASFAAQALAVGALLVLPLIYTQGLPRLQLMAALVAPPPPPAPPPGPARVRPANLSASNTLGTLVSPPTIPNEIAHIIDSEAPPPPVLPPGMGVRNGTGVAGSRSPVWDSIGNASTEILPPPPPPRRVSRMMEGNLIHRVQPEYPPLARQARIQGEVVLHAVISRDGTIENLQVVSGHPMLVQAAVSAVRQWRYRPYYLNGEPMEVETQVTVNFILSDG